MIVMHSKTLIVVWAVSLSVAAAARAADLVALRVDNDRFVHVGSDGVLRAESLIPADGESFELVSRGKQEIALKGPDGRSVVPVDRDHRTLRLGPSQAAPGDAQIFRLVPSGSDRFTLCPHGTSGSVVFHPADPRRPSL